MVEVSRYTGALISAWRCHGTIVGVHVTLSDITYGRRLEARRQTRDKGLGLEVYTVG